MMLRRWPGLLTFELRYQALRFTFAATVLLLTFMAFALVATRFGSPADAVNGAFLVTQSLALLSLMAVFAMPMLCVHAALRDDEHGMRALIESRPVSRREILAMRFGGVLTLALAAMLVAALVLMLTPMQWDIPPDRLTTFRIQPYLRAFLLLMVPNILWCAALLFAVAAATRSTLATFVASIAIYAGYLVTAMMVDSPIMAGTRPPSPELLARAALLDPFGLSAFFEQTRYLTPTERSVHTLSLSGHLLQNRVGVMLFAVLCLTPLAAIDRRRSLGGGTPRRWWTRRSHAGNDIAVTGAGVTVPQVQPAVANTIAWQRAARAVATLESRLLMKSWPLLALLVLWIVVIAIEADGQLKGGDYGTRVLASTAQLADAVPMGLAMLGSLCVLYFAADVFGRERVHRFDGIRDATPAASTALLTGKTLALLVVPVLLTITGYGTTLVMHLLVGGLPVEWDVLAWHVLTSLLPLVVTTGMAAALQVLIGQRWIALVLGLAIVLFASQGQALGAEHPLWRFGSLPAIEWSDLDGFGTTLQSWLAFQGLWLLGAGLLLWMAAALWSRGEALSLTARLRHAPALMAQTLTPRGRRGLAVGALLYTALLVVMAWQTTVATAWTSRNAAMARRVSYEQRYRVLATRPQPSVQHVETHVTLEPARQHASIRGRLHLVNATGAAVDTLWLDFPDDAADVRVGAAADSALGSAGDPLSSDMQQRRARHAPHDAVHDTQHGVVRVALTSPLMPGDSMPLAFALTLARGGVRAEASEIDVVENGTLLHSSDFLPHLGYRRGRELRDSAQRVAHGLMAPATPLLLPASANDSLAEWARTHGQSPAWFTASVYIITAADQVAHGPGLLVNSTLLAGESHWHYRTTRPTTPAFVITSGRYAVHRAVVRTARGAVPVEVWHNPVHAEPATRLLDIAITSLTRLEREFGTYPHDVLRIVEVPRAHRFGAYAMPGSIYLTETRGLLADAREGDVDLLLRRIGHEVAHQWWGHAVNPLDTEGRLLLVETMAKYAEQILLEEGQGTARLLDMLAVDEDRYLSARHADEATLLTMQDESALYYSKGTMAMYALRRTLGDSAVRAVLRHVIATESGPHGAATARSLAQQFVQAAATAEARAAVYEWMGQRVIYDLAADTATFRSGGSGGTHITAQFTARRAATTGTGAAAREEVTPLHETTVPVGALDDRGTWHVFPALARAGVVRVDTLLPVPVHAIEIDPQRLHIDRDRSNNRISAPVVPVAAFAPVGPRTNPLP